MPMRGGRDLLGKRMGGFFAEVATGVIVVVDQKAGRTAAEDGWSIIEQLRAEGFNLALPVLYRSVAGHWSWLRLAGRSSVDVVAFQAVEYSEVRIELWKQTHRGDR